MKERVGCDSISDLPYRKRAVWEEIKRLSPTAYPKEQLEKFSHYVFGVDYAVIMGILEMKKGSETPVGNEMKAIQQKWFSSFEEFIDHKDEIRYYDVGYGADLAEYLICEENVFGEIPHELQKHIDYHSYGSELEMDDRYLFTTSGAFRYQ